MSRKKKKKDIAFIDVGIARYDISQVDKLEGCLGRTDHNNLEIEILGGLKPDKALIVLWHEVRHCVLHEFGVLEGVKADVSNGDNFEEALVSRATQAELIVMRDNIELFKRIIHYLEWTKKGGDRK